MKIIQPLRIYDSLSLEVSKPKSELLDILKSRAKALARFIYGDKIMIMTTRHNFDTTRVESLLKILLQENQS